MRLKWLPTLKNTALGNNAHLHFLPPFQILAKSFAEFCSLFFEPYHGNQHERRTNRQIPSKQTNEPRSFWKCCRIENRHSLFKLNCNRRKIPNIFEQFWKKEVLTLLIENRIKVSNSNLFDTQISSLKYLTQQTN